MRALSLSTMTWQVQPRPSLGPSEVLIRVMAAGLNRADLLQRAGKYPPPHGVTEIPGLEAAGIVEAVGTDVADYQPGDRVMALLAGGGMATYVAADAGSVLRVPDNLSWAQAAAVPEVFATAWQCLQWVARAQTGECVLVHAGASGVGTAAIVLGKALGMNMIATASGGKTAACLALGASQAIDYQTEDFGEVLGAASVDVVLDPIGASYWERNLRVLRPDGRLVLLAAMSGAKLADASLAPVLLKRLQILGTTLRSRPLAYKAALMADLGQFLLPKLADGSIQSVIDQVFDAENIESAFKHLASNKTIGKVILEID